MKQVAHLYNKSAYYSQINPQVPADLLSYTADDLEGSSASTAGTTTAGMTPGHEVGTGLKVAAVRGHVDTIFAMLDEAKKEELEQAKMVIIS